jgi:hypothetical protein
MAYTFAQLLTKLSTQLRDTSDTRWTSSEKTEALTEGFEDPALSYYAEDSSLTADMSTQSYSVPTGVETVVDIALEDSRGIETRIDPKLWEQKYGKIIFNKYPPMTGVMNITAIKKYVETDTLPREMSNLLLALAGKVCY